MDTLYILNNSVVISETLQNICWIFWMHTHVLTHTYILMHTGMFKSLHKLKYWKTIFHICPSFVAQHFFYRVMKRRSHMLVFVYEKLFFKEFKNPYHAFVTVFTAISMPTCFDPLDLAYTTKHTYTESHKATLIALAIHTRVQVGYRITHFSRRYSILSLNECWRNSCK